MNSVQLRNVQWRNKIWFRRLPITNYPHINNKRHCKQQWWIQLHCKQWFKIKIHNCFISYNTNSSNNCSNFINKISDLQVRSIFEKKTWTIKLNLYSQPFQISIRKLETYFADVRILKFSQWSSFCPQQNVRQSRCSIRGELLNVRCVTGNIVGLYYIFNKPFFRPPFLPPRFSINRTCSNYVIMWPKISSRDTKSNHMTKNIFSCLQSKSNGNLQCNISTAQSTAKWSATNSSTPITATRKTTKWRFWKFSNSRRLQEWIHLRHVPSRFFNFELYLGFARNFGKILKFSH